MREHNYYVYLMTNAARTVLYTGMTNDLRRRVSEHREGKIKGFTKRNQVNRLVYYEYYEHVDWAIEREKTIKGWRREKKNALVASMNPRWGDLAVSEFEFDRAPVPRWEERKHKPRRQR